MILHITFVLLSLLSCQRPFSGTNQYYLFYQSKPAVDDFFARAQALELSVVRTWAFCDGTSQRYCFQPRPYHYDEPTFAKLDYVVAKAQEKGMRLILPLVNNWEAFGGIPQYLAWYSLKSHDQFYTDARAKNTYKAYVRHLLNRRNTITGHLYKEDPTILAWELGNELRSADLPAYYAWIEEMSAFIKSIDKHHPLTTGSEGSHATDPYLTHKSKNIDYVSFHLYPDQWSLSLEQAEQYILEHVRVARRLNKPLVLGEFGVRDHKMRRKAFASWYALFKRVKIDGALFWLLSGKQDDGTEYPDYDGYTVYYPHGNVVDLILKYGREIK